MARSILLVALLASGCGFSGAASDASSDDAVDDSSVDDEVPDGDENPDDSNPDDDDDDDDDDDASVDTDGDGYPDTTDNCPDLSQIDQRDHDADGVGDACDPCPHLPENGDGDGDGVGDACDPRPATPGDGHLMFYGFDADTVDISTWNRAGQWSVGDGALSVTIPSGGPQFISLPEAPGTVYMMAGVEVDLSAQGDSRAGILVGQQGTFPSISRYYACETERGQVGLDYNAYAQWDGDTPLDWSVGGTLGLGANVVYTLYLSGSQFECTWSGDNFDDTAMVNPIGERGTSITLGTQTGGLMSVDYVFLAKPGG